MSTIIQLFKSLLEISLFASVMIIIILLIRAIAQDKISIKIVSFLWTLVILRLCFLGMLESPLHIDALFLQPAEPIEEPVSFDYDTSYEQDNYINAEFGSEPVNNLIVPLENGNAANDITVSEPKEVSIWNKTISFIQSIDLWTVLSIIWIAGGAIVILSVIIESMIFAVNTKKNSQLIKDQTILDMVISHRRANSIRRKIYISACSSIEMPLTFGIFKPKILLPSHMVNKLKYKHISAIILHEMCHIKRKDVLKSYILILAKALHWFNPLVWISIIKIKEDMEFACDQMVMNMLSKEHKIQYCESLIHTTRFIKQSKIPQLVTSLCGNKSNLKERIIKMVRPQKKSKLAITTSLALALIMIIACFTTACQPTPDELIVQNKADGELMEVINSQNPTDASATSPDESTDLQGNMQTTVLNYKTVDHVEFDEELSNGIKLEVNSDIIVPDVESFPVVSYRRKELTQDVVDNMIQAIIGEQPLYELPGAGTGMWTKSEIQEMIVNTKYEYDNLQSLMAVTKGITDLTELHALRDELLEDLYVQLETAPDELPLVLHSGKIEDSHIYAMTYLNQSKAELKLVTESLDYSNIRLSISMLDSAGAPLTGIFYDMRQYGNLVSTKKTVLEDMGQEIVLGMDLDLMPITSQPDTMTMTPEEAIVLAETTFIDMGAGENVKVSNIYYLEIPEKNMVCYAVELKRYIGNMPIEIIPSDNVGIEGRSTDEFFNSGVPNERMSVFITDEGIIDIEWREPIEIVEILNTDVELIETDNVVEVFKQEFRNSYIYYTDEDPLPYELDQIRLNYGLARIIDNNNLYMAIPLWDFFAGQKKIGGWSNGEYDEEMESYVYKSMITINAIDGSRFSRFYGY